MYKPILGQDIRAVAEANLKNGMQLDFSGMSEKQLGTVSGLFYDNGFILKANKEKGHYTLKQNF